VSRELDAVTIVGLLADDDRRQVLAALILGDATLDEVVRTTALSTTAAAKALGRLADSGLVVQGSEGGLHLVAEAFRVAARSARQQESADAGDEHADVPDEAKKVMRAFVRDGKIVQIPTTLSKKIVLLDWLAQDFELGRRYTEQQVNLIIAKRHPDTAAWRRYLVDSDFLDRADGEYWRSGGTVPTA
jgi:hypothetical protein